jgi:hypothetical protein
MANTVAAQLLIDGVYTSKTAFVDEGITVQIGPDPDSGTQPSRVDLTFDNSDLSMDPSNVLSPLYGKIGRYTPLKLLVGGTALANVEATDWEPDRTIGHQVTPARGRSWTSVTGYGILDRLKLWKEPLRSAMYQQIKSYATMLGYWPLEGSGTLLTNTTTGPNGLPVGTVNAAGDPGPSGSDTTVQLGSDGAMSFRFLPASGNGYQVCWVMKVPNVLTATYFTMMSWTTTDGVRFEWQINSTSWNWLITAPDGTVLVSTPASFGTGVSPLNWTRYRVKVTWSAGTVTVEPAWYPQDASVIYGTTFTYSFGGTGRPLSATVQPNTYTNGAAYGHLFALTNTTLDLIGTFNAVAVMNGYAGETAGARFVRLMGQIGIAAVLVGNASDTIAMGPQKPGLVLDLLQECADTDHALLYDDPATPAVAFRTRANRYGQTSKLDLTYSVNVAPPLKKQINPVGVANVVTVTNWSGSTATVAKTTGTLSTAVPPAGVGEIRGSVDVNQKLEALLDDRAAWELILSTTDRPRYQQITVDLLAHPELITAVNALRPGDLVTLAGVEPDPVLLHVIQMVHNIGHTTRTVILKCVPGDMWNVGVYGTSRYTVRNSGVNTAMTTTSTSLAVLLTDPKDYWSQTATGYDIVINGGERVTVTTPFSAPSGLVQTATVTRSVNGVVTTHAAGEPVMLFRAPRYAFTTSGSGGLIMVAGGDVIAAGDINRVRPSTYYSEATSALAASMTITPVPGISIVFTTATANAELTLWWTMRADPTGTTTNGLISCRPSAVGSGTAASFTATPTTNFAIAEWSAGAANDVLTVGNSGKIILGPAGTYTVTLLGTTQAAETIGLYSQVTAMVQEVAP